MNFLNGVDAVCERMAEGKLEAVNVTVIEEDLILVNASNPIHHLSCALFIASNEIEAPPFSNDRR